MASEAQDESGAKVSQPIRSEHGPFILRTLLDDVPLAAEDVKGEVKINCVDYLGTLSLRI